MLLFIAFLGCGKKTELPISSARSIASVGNIAMLEGNYGIENSSDCDGNITPIVTQTIEQVADCHNTSLRTNPGARGLITLETKIVHGRVMSAKTSSNATGDQSVAACIEGVANNWRFATACTGMASVSFNLSAQD